MTKLQNSSGSLLWDDKSETKTYYQSASKLINKNGQLKDNYIKSDSKAAQLIDQAKLNGTIEDIYNCPDTIGLTAGIYRDKTWGSGNHYKIRIIDIGKISEIVQASPLKDDSFSQYNKIYNRFHNPFFIRPQSNMQSAYDRRKFEIYFYFNPELRNPKIKQTHTVVHDLLKHIQL